MSAGKKVIKRVKAKRPAAEQEDGEVSPAPAGKKVVKKKLVKKVAPSADENGQKTPVKKRSKFASQVPVDDNSVYLTKKEQREEDEEAKMKAFEIEKEKELQKLLAAEATDFEQLPVCDQIKRAMREEFGFKTMTEIQRRCIPALLAGKDVLGQAKTGSGKTLSFVIPMVELLERSNFMQRNGTGALIIAPVRELCMQIETVVSQVVKFFSGRHTFACVTGGVNKRPEAEKLAKGVNVLIATPGRLLDHLQTAPNFVYQNLLSLCIDEADRILMQGFEEQMRDIINILPKKRLTMLFSATQTTKVEDLIRISFPKPPLYIAVQEASESATADNLEQGYVVCPADLRFLLLYTFLKKQKGKVIVFFSSCKSVQFHSELLNYIDIPNLALHGKLKQQRRSVVFNQFMNAPKGILLTTDVAARGFDIPSVDWIVQFDPPDQPRTYIHRVGRTARAGSSGNALLFLLPEEVGFLKYLRQSKVACNQYDFKTEKLSRRIQQELEKLIEKNYYLHKSAREAYRAYLLAYASHSMQEVFNVGQLDLAKVARSVGLKEAPAIDFNLVEQGQKSQKKAMKRQAAGPGFGKTFEDEEGPPQKKPKGKTAFGLGVRKTEGDGRQWKGSL